MHKGVSDPLEVVAKGISDESILLCLDEFMVLKQKPFFNLIFIFLVQHMNNDFSIVRLGVGH
jgi:hypothetical protein